MTRETLREGSLDRSLDDRTAVLSPYMDLPKKAPG